MTYGFKKKNQNREMSYSIHQYLNISLDLEVAICLDFS